MKSENSFSNMSFGKKSILTIPSIIGIIFMLTFFNVDFFKWLNNNIINYVYQGVIVNGIILFQIIYLIFRLWSYRNIDKETKTKWTWILFLFSFISSLFYIWKKDNEFYKKNNN